MMTLLALDPGSLRTGYSAWSGDLLIEAGVLRASSRSPALERVDAICDDLVDLADRIQPAAVVIEIPGVDCRTRTTIGRLASYIMAAGALYRQARLLAGVESVTAVTAAAWTRGRAKARRIPLIAAAYPAFGPAIREDPDIADAVSIGDWFIGKHRGQR